jgi:hypothetical protein
MGLEGPEVNNKKQESVPSYAADGRPSAGVEWKGKRQDCQAQVKDRSPS